MIILIIIILVKKKIYCGWEIDKNRKELKISREKSKRKKK